MDYIIASVQIGILIISLIVFSGRIEHRLTKIETDISWLKLKINPLCKNSKGKD